MSVREKTVLKSEPAGVTRADAGRADLAGIQQVTAWAARTRASPIWMAHEWHTTEPEGSARKV